LFATLEALVSALDDLSSHVDTTNAGETTNDFPGSCRRQSVFVVDAGVVHSDSDFATI
jgi:hypothetical protein